MITITMMHSFTGHCMSPQISHKILRDVSEISIVSSWALTVVFHCEYQPRRWWISPFSSDLVTNSYRPLWCQRQSVGSCYREHDCWWIHSPGSEEAWKPYDTVGSRSCWWIKHHSHNLQGPLTEWWVLIVHCCYSHHHLTALELSH